LASKSGSAPSYHNQFPAQEACAGLLSTIAARPRPFKLPPLPITMLVGRASNQFASDSMIFQSVWKMPLGWTA